MWGLRRPPGQRRVLHRIAGLPVRAAVLAAVLAGCGGVPGTSAPVRPEPVPARETPSAVTDAPADSPAPDGTAPAFPPEPKVLPAPYCGGGPLDCRIYRSTGGRDSSGKLGWLEEQPLEISNMFANGTWTIGVLTPCNELGVEVEVMAGQWIPGRTAGTAMACLGPEAGYEEWVRGLFSQAVSWEKAGRSLVLSNAHGTVEFEDAGPSVLQPPPGASAGRGIPRGTGRGHRPDAQGGFVWLGWPYGDPRIHP